MFYYMNELLSNIYGDNFILKYHNGLDKKGISYFVIVYYFPLTYSVTHLYKNLN